MSSTGPAGPLGPWSGTWCRLPTDRFICVCLDPIETGQLVSNMLGAVVAGEDGKLVVLDGNLRPTDIGVKFGTRSNGSWFLVFQGPEGEAGEPESGHDTEWIEFIGRHGGGDVHRLCAFAAAAGDELIYSAAAIDGLSNGWRRVAGYRKHHLPGGSDLLSSGGEAYPTPQEAKEAALNALVTRLTADVPFSSQPDTTPFDLAQLAKTKAALDLFPGVAPSPLPRTNGYRLSLRDAGHRLSFNSDKPVTVRIPHSSDVPFPLGTTITLDNQGKGPFLFKPDQNVLLFEPSPPTPTDGTIVALQTAAQDGWDVNRRPKKA